MQIQVALGICHGGFEIRRSRGTVFKFRSGRRRMMGAREEDQRMNRESSWELDCNSTGL